MVFHKLNSSTNILNSMHIPQILKNIHFLQTENTAHFTLICILFTKILFLLLFVLVLSVKFCFINKTTS